MDPNNQQPFQGQAPLPQDQAGQDPGVGAFPPQPLAPAQPENQFAQAPMPPAPEPQPQVQPQPQAFPPQQPAQAPAPMGMPAMPMTDPGMPPAPSPDPQAPMPPVQQPSPTDPSLNNAGMAVPPAMANNPEMAGGTTGSAGGRKALGFVFVIGGVIALIVLIVIAIRML